MALIPLLVNILILVLIAGLIWWVIGLIGLPEPFNKAVRIIFAIIVVLLLMGMLMGNFPVLVRI